MDKRFPVLAEVTRALVVLALFLLNLAYPAPASAVGVGYEQNAITVNCGFTELPDHSAHAPCHACRSDGGAVLPPPPVNGLPIRFGLAQIEYAHPAEQLSLDPVGVAHRSRAPPFQA